MKGPKEAQVGDFLQVVDKMPSGGVWGYPFSVDPDTWLMPVEPDYEAAASKKAEGTWITAREIVDAAYGVGGE